MQEPVAPRATSPQASPTSVDSIIFNTFNGTYTLGSSNQTITLTNGIMKNANSSTVTITSPISLAADQTWSNVSRSCADP